MHYYHCYDVKKQCTDASLYLLCMQVKATMEKTLRQSLGRRIEVKVGHGGTLDPIATGVLVLGLGAACKDISSFLKVSDGL